MITRLRARGYRSLRSVDVALPPFLLLIGPNASGKSTVLEVLDLLGQLMRRRGDVRETLSSISPNFYDLLWPGEESGFELSIEASIPERLRASLRHEAAAFDTVEYSVSISLDGTSNELGIDRELLSLVSRSSGGSGRGVSTMESPGIRDWFKLMTRFREDANLVSYFPDETGVDIDSPEFRPLRSRLGRGTSALQAMPADGSTYTVAHWLRGVLADGVRRIDLDDSALAAPSPAGLGRAMLPSGANLPRSIAALRRDGARFVSWLRHVRSALPDLKDVEVIEREEDRASYLRVIYENGTRVPSWLVSAGTLRLMALTILPYLSTDEAVYLVEEPETGIHPRALEAVMESLRSVYGGQVLVTTHSLLTVNLVNVEELLCTSRGGDGETVLVAGPDHPVLKRWTSERSSLGTLFASGGLAPLP